MEVKMSVVIWVVRPCVIGGYQHFRQIYNHRLQDRKVMVVAVAAVVVVVIVVVVVVVVNSQTLGGIPFTF
jgi:hypothetical protein